MKFKHTLILTYTFLALVLVTITFSSINFIFKKNFKEYAINNQLIKNEEIIHKLIHSHIKNKNFSEAEIIGVDALDRGMILKLEDKNGKIIFNAIDHDNLLCKEMLENMASEMEKYHEEDETTYEEKKYELKNGEELLGTAYISYYGPYYYNDNDIEYLNNFTFLIITLALFSFIFAASLGIIFSQKIAFSLEKILNATKNLFNSDYKKEIIDRNNIEEFSEIIKYINDISKKLSNEKEKRDRLTTDIAHELRTPLAIVKGNIEAMIDGVYEINEGNLKILNDEISKLNNLIEKIESIEQNENMSYSEFKLDELINKKIASFSNEINKKKIKLEKQIESFKIKADYEKIESAITNLLSNAIKYTDVSGNIKIKLSKKKKDALFEISNSGEVIKKEDREKIFERFYRADTSRTKATGGHGIGLSIVKSIVISHGGKIYLKDELETTFVVEMPIDPFK